MRLERIKVADIVPYENNPRKNDEAVNAVAESIRQCTYITPIIIDEDRVVIAGHTRLKALKALGIEEVEVLVCDGMSEEKKRKYRILDNKTGERATWDLMKLEEELQDLDLDGFSFFGIDPENVEKTYNFEERIKGSVEYDLEDFDETSFKYQCPVCGFQFN